MNGECKSFRLNDPMTWNEFVSMPEDIQVTYIKLLREKFGCPDAKIGEMMGADKDKVSRYFKKLGLRQGHVKRSKPFDKEGFYAWVNRVDKLPTPVLEEAPVPEEKEAALIEEPVNVAMGMSYIANQEAFVEEDITWSVPDSVPYDPIHEKCMALEVENKELHVRIDELMKCNIELMAEHKCDSQAIEKWRLACIEYEEKVKILEAKMEVVQLIFGGKNNG